MGDRQNSEDGAQAIDLRAALEERYLAYALSTIMHRALPDVRDGLKPVHRRLLYAMQQLKLDPEGGFKKCARVVGDLIGKYHPHGDQAAYDALVRLAQDFAVRYPLIEGQGNFGNIDGDNAAAMRYTEAKLTQVAAALLENIGDDTVDFRETYDGSESEPVVLPANFPNILANGATGIAVGMATSIPPHNAGELCDAALHLIKYPNASVEKLVEYVPGPDLPTGGIIVEPADSIIEAYRTGRGGFRVRARWEQETLGRGSYQIVVSEIPYQVQKARLIEKIAELMQARKLPLLADIRDESAEEIRIVFVPRSRSVDAELLMESLFRLTDLESRISLNMNVLSRGKIPNVLPLNKVLNEWLEHRKNVLERRSRDRLAKIDHRLDVLAGYLVAYLNLDQVIAIVRHEDDPKSELMRVFRLADMQAEAILNMRLRALRKLEEIAIRGENEKLQAERGELKTLLGSDKLQWSRITGEIRDIRKRFGVKTESGRRRTSFAAAPEVEVNIAAAMIEQEPVTIVLSQKGWIRAMRGHLDDISSLQFKDGDSLKRARPATTIDTLVLFATNGKFYSLDAGKLPGGRGNGEPVRLMVEMEETHDILEMFVHQPG
ncbi:MAG: DNA topoisomerase IV subunit A, partial [Proteobacteria bacterium]|nr:DNA topoisomerase IV subunit A [Pseudomonadota bacterium]